MTNIETTDNCNKHFSFKQLFSLNDQMRCQKDTIVLMRVLTHLKKIDVLAGDNDIKYEYIERNTYTESCFRRE
jgi:hypothetical protein